MSESSDLASILTELKRKVSAAGKASNANVSFTYMRQVGKIMKLTITKLQSSARGPLYYSRTAFQGNWVNTTQIGFPYTFPITYATFTPLDDLDYDTIICGYWVARNA